MTVECVNKHAVISGGAANDFSMNFATLLLVKNFVLATLSLGSVEVSVSLGHPAA
jgi:hypothetical protein